jgi:hypothetical protein
MDQRSVSMQDAECALPASRQVLPGCSPQGDHCACVHLNFLSLVRVTLDPVVLLEG